MINQNPNPTHGPLARLKLEVAPIAAQSVDDGPVKPDMTYFDFETKVNMRVTKVDHGTIDVRFIATRTGEMGTMHLDLSKNHVTGEFDCYPGQFSTGNPAGMGVAPVHAMENFHKEIAGRPFVQGQSRKPNTSKACTP